MNTADSTSTLTPTTTPRARRGDVAVFAQYIQDLTHAGSADARPAA